MLNFPNVKNKIAIIVDDGMATGHTVLAAVRAVMKGKPKRVIVAVPVASGESVKLVKTEAVEVVCLMVPEFFMAVGNFYRSFPQLQDSDVISLVFAVSAVKKKIKRSQN